MPETRADTSASDVELLQAVRAGDHGAFAEIYRRHQPGALRYARALVDWADADDVVAEAFAKVLRAMQGGAGPVDHPERYLSVAVRTTAAEQWARKNRARSYEENHQFVQEEAPVEILDAPDDDELARAFAGLSSRWRSVLWLREVEGRSAVEVAELLGLSPNAVNALAFRARDGLRRAYLELTANRDDSVP